MIFDADRNLISDMTLMFYLTRHFMTENLNNKLYSLILHWQVKTSYALKAFKNKKFQQAVNINLYQLECKTF